MLTRQSIQESARRLSPSPAPTVPPTFASSARWHGDATESSDLDMIVRLEPGRSLLDHGGLVMDLRELLGRRVDVIVEQAMRPRFRQHVMKEAIRL